MKATIAVPRTTTPRDLIPLPVVSSSAHPLLRPRTPPAVSLTTSRRNGDEEVEQHRFNGFLGISIVVCYNKERHPSHGQFRMWTVAGRQNEKVLQFYKGFNPVLLNRSPGWPFRSPSGQTGNMPSEMISQFTNLVAEFGWTFTLH